MSRKQIQQKTGAKNFKEILCFGIDKVIQIELFSVPSTQDMNECLGNQIKIAYSA